MNNVLSLPLAMAFLFVLGAVGGWILEFLFRNLISHKGPKGRYFINPGFCKGPWLPIYGIGVAVLCTLSYMIVNMKLIDPQYVNTVGGKIVIILVLGIVLNVIEFIGGLFLLKVLHLRLWDYRDCKGNIMGITCPQFALIWVAIAAIYYLFLHGIFTANLEWFANNLGYAFGVGLFFGFFILDLWSSFVDANLVKKFAADRDVIVRYEDLKALMLQKLMESDKKQSFFNQIIVKGMDFERNMEDCIDAMDENAK